MRRSVLLIFVFTLVLQPATDQGPDAWAAPPPKPENHPSYGGSGCNDGADNDSNGAVDCADSNCSSKSFCESTETLCSDGFDNDGDGLADGADSDCSGGDGDGDGDGDGEGDGEGDGDGASTGSCIPGFEYAMFADDETEYNGTADVDHWDSKSGTYASTKACGDQADVGTNSTKAGDLQVNGGPVICGDAAVGAGGDPSTVITGGGGITGGREALDEPIDLEDVDVPSFPNASPFSRSGTGVLTPNRRYGAISCSGGPGSYLELQKGSYVVESLALSGQCSIKVTEGPVSVYFTDSLDITGGSVTNTTGIPGNLIFFGSSTATSVSLKGNSQAYFAVYAPQAHCAIGGTADIFGAAVCKTAKVAGTPGLHYDTALREFEGGGFTCEIEEREVARSSPIIADLDGNGELQFQGSLEAINGSAPIFTGAADFEFPHSKGHLRAIDVASLSSSEVGFGSDSLTVRFDAASHIPEATASGCATRFSSSCRTVFSSTGATGSPFIDKVFLETEAPQRDALKPYLDPASSWTDPQIEILITRILAGKKNGSTYEPALGGIDWSTMAIVKPSTFAGSSTRPTMMYAGGHDGMLHAFCAEGGVGACTTAGQELWAYIPRTQLSLLQTNAARIDGSPTVSDVFGDADGDGRNEFRTVLTFQTGSGTGGDADSPPAVYALDISDPESPNIMWEVITPGPGIDTAMGATEGGEAATFIQTSTGASGNAGSYVASIDTNTGDINWSYSYSYPAPRTGGNDRIPNTALPGGVSIVDANGQNAMTHVIVPGLYGEVFILNAKDGSNDYGADVPAVRFANDYNPIGVSPTIYADQSTGTLHGLVATGGYVDSTRATQWAPDGTGQFAVSFPLDIPVSSAPLRETDSLIDFKIDFAAGERAYASAVVAGNEVFIVTDSSNVNASDYGTSTTGSLRRFNVSTGAAIGTSTAIAGGASSVGVSTGTGSVYSGGGGGAQRVELPDFDASGTAVDLAAKKPLVKRLMWLEL